MSAHHCCCWPHQTPSRDHPPHTSPALTTGQSGQRIKPCLCPCCRGGPRRKHAKWARSCRPTVGLSERHWAFSLMGFSSLCCGLFRGTGKRPVIYQKKKSSDAFSLNVESACGLPSAHVAGLLPLDTGRCDLIPGLPREAATSRARDHSRRLSLRLPPPNTNRLKKRRKNKRKRKRGRRRVDLEFLAAAARLHLRRRLTHRPKPSFSLRLQVREEAGGGGGKRRAGHRRWRAGLVLGAGRCVGRPPVDRRGFRSGVWRAGRRRLVAAVGN